MTLSTVKEILSRVNPEIVLSELESTTPGGFLIPKDQIHLVCQLLRDTEGIYMDLLSCISAIDNGPDVGTMDMMYHLYSVTTELSLTLKVQMDRNNAVIDSVADIWRTADWHEREAFDLLGVKFDGHPDLRRILLPSDWEGFPLRKDYLEQEKYHGITVKYDRE